jgi:FOG: TPR repeat
MMTKDPNTLFAEAGDLAERGAYGAAAEIYRQLLTMIPGHPQVLAGLGAMELELGHVDEAIALFEKALAVSAPQPEVWFNLARAYRSAGQLDAALKAIDTALKLAPNFFEAFTARGNILWDMERMREALSAYDHAVALRPDDARAHFNRANARRALGQYDRAVESFARAIVLSSGYADAHKNLALTYQSMGRVEEALAAIDKALALNPGDGDMRDARGQILHGLGRFEDAVDELSRALALRPQSALAYSNRGVSLHAAGRLDEALVDFEKAMALDPSYADAVVNRGTLLKDLGRFAEAGAAYQAALAIDPGHHEASWNTGLMALMQGDFANGWKGYEGRWKSKVQAHDYLITPKPQWRGEAIGGKTILLWWEQGYGDFIQFCRYAPLVADRGARVILEAPPRLKSLIARLDDRLTVMGPEARGAGFDLHCPLMSLPLAFATRQETVPNRVPYLSADPAKTAEFAAMLEPVDGGKPRVGLVWSANAKNIHASARHMPPQSLEPLLDLPFAFHVVQKDFSPADEAWLNSHPLPVHAEAQTDFLAAAALISAMDLIVTVDTSVAHLAGALAKPVFMLLPHIADWRWMAERSDTPWYPSMRLFRQPARGDWAGAVALLRAALKEWRP